MKLFHDFDQRHARVLCGVDAGAHPGAGMKRNDYQPGEGRDDDHSDRHPHHQLN
jgi:hypothetical protein